VSRSTDFRFARRVFPPLVVVVAACTVPTRDIHPVDTTTSTSTTGSAGSTSSSTSGSAGSAGSSTTTTASTTSSTSGGGTKGTGGSAGAGGAGGGSAGSDGGTPSSCTSQTPTGTRMCASGETCLRSSCGPPPQYSCFQAGAVMDGAPCTYSTDCAAGMICIGYRSDLSVCRKICALDADCNAGYRCLGSSSGCMPAIQGKYCQKLCDNITREGATSCGTGFKCDISCTDSGANPAMCLLAGSLTSGSCSSYTDCAAGYTCFDSVCTATCRTNADCTGGATCSQDIFCAGTVNTGFHVCKAPAPLPQPAE
jgi:hypothetical protein